ncbi:MAG: methylhydantoinase [Pirellula sp.]|nr:methylhydantoinase [Pirellula sp.]
MAFFHRAGMMLTFEYRDDEKTLFVHGDIAGLRSLAEYIQRLIAQTPDGTFDHSHLMTPEWGGEELTSTPQDPTAGLIHHVKLYCWKGGQPA